ncbi:TetR/AcrR family transcriptional regulator [Phytohabitans houttuyneae]|uniref:TetR family transcriptional regulator n=1 Tax=Phytohabitans houttuyneae TaxID=1076126 RepID=A0A6V8K196_9ACTN|nr:TetR/AcrR family transcriptional regulator [Phytohabitans houttuyneae]GFJ76048.1 TetR family transcriptional regulator [Phytohabitans houttuyneae]
MAGGRPRAFDEDAALDRAVEVFWRQGYEGTALSDLTAAMGINRPSLYGAFGNKEALFRRVLDRYIDGPGGFSAAALAEPRARDVVATMLRGAVGLTTDPAHPGCLSVRNAQACGPEGEPVRKVVVERRNAGLAALRDRLERAREEGDLPPGADPAALARYVFTVSDGLAAQAASGATPADLRKVVDIVLEAWPGQGEPPG